MNNPVATQDRGRRQTKHKNNTENLNDEQHGPHPKPGVNTCAREGKQCLSLIRHVMLLI